MPKQNMSAEADPLAGGTDMAPQTVPFSVANDFVKGTFVNRKSVTTQYGPSHILELKLQVGRWHDKEGKQEIIGSEGEYVGIFGGKNQIDGLFAKCKLGDIVGIQLVELKPTKKGNPWKNFKTKHFGVDSTWMGEDSQSLHEAAEDAF